MSARTGAASVSLLALMLVGCTLEPIDVASASCPSLRVTAGGTCCPTWSRASGYDCAHRTWALQDGPLDEAAADPALAVTDDGAVAVAWTRVMSPAAAAVLVAHEDDGYLLRSPTAPLEGRVEQPRIAVGTDGSTTVVWRRAFDGETRIEASTRTAQGAWRNNPEPLSFSPGGNEPEVATGVDGEVIAIWNQWAGEHLGVAVARRPPGRLDFDRPKDAFDQISPPVAFSNDPVIAINRRGDGLICWFQSIGGTLATIVSTRSGPHGEFEAASAADALSPLDSPVEDPVVALADDGQAIVAWRQELPGGRAAIFLAEREADGTWRKPGSLAESFSEPADEAWDVRVAMSPVGHAYVVWEERRGDDLVIASAMRALDGRWIVSGRAPAQLSTPGVASVDPVVVVGSQGHVVAAWTELTTPSWRIVSSRTSYADGPSKPWSPPEVVSLDGGASASSAALAIGGGGARVALAFLQGASLRLATID